jgi:sec-independent protein translocase protein TatA
MGSFSIWHWLIVLAIVLVLFGKGKISTLMGDVAQGVKAFKKGLAEDEPDNVEEVSRKVVASDATQPVHQPGKS